VKEDARFKYKYTK